MPHGMQESWGCQDKLPRGVLVSAEVSTWSQIVKVLLYGHIIFCHILRDHVVAYAVSVIPLMKGHLSMTRVKGRGRLQSMTQRAPQ